MKLLGNSKNKNIDNKINNIPKINDYRQKKIFEKVSENIEYLKTIQENSWDLITNELVLENKYQKIPIGIVYYTGLIDQQFLNKTIIDGLGENFKSLDHELKTPEQIFEYFRRSMLLSISIDDAEDYGKLYNLLASGDLVLFLDNWPKCIIIGARMYQERPVEKPTTQITVKGSNDAFNENLLTNISLIRKRIKNPNLIVKNLIIGNDSNTNVAIMYIKGLANPKTIQEVSDKLSKINIPNILDSSYIMYYLHKGQFTLFPLVYDTERPDSIMGSLCEGRIAILVDNSPFVLVLPTVFIQFIQSTEDYFQKSVFASFFRILRLLAFFLAVFLPALYTVIIFHNSELLPIVLISSIAGQRINVPLPAAIELFLIMIAFDILKEGGTRMPTALGSTLSFVGAIIIGQSAVEAGLISPIIVIIVALIGICGLLLPNYNLNLTVSILRYPVTLATVFLGFYGLTLSAIVIIIHLSSLKSFGVNYFAPFAPINKSALSDSFIRLPLKKMFKKKNNTLEKMHQ